MVGWIVQWYGYDPAVANVRATLVSALFGTSAGAPLVAVNVTLCVTASNVNVTLVPLAIVRLVGLNRSEALAMTVFAGGVVVPPVPVLVPGPVVEL